MKGKKIVSHRCEGVKKWNTPIRYGNPYEYVTASFAVEGWWLYKMDVDFDYDSHYMNPISVINTCPYCGEKLERPE